MFKTNIKFVNFLNLNKCFGCEELITIEIYFNIIVFLFKLNMVVFS